MKYIINESQSKAVIENTINKLAQIYFKRQISRNEDPHIDDSLLMMLGVKLMSSGYVYLLNSIERFLGPETAYKVGVKRSKKTFDTNDYPDIKGGYNFKFTLNLDGFHEESYIFDVKILPDAEVTLIMTDGETHPIKDLINHEDIGWEIENEIKDIIDDILIREIGNYTGYFINIKDVKLT